jgi:hypothetical protein
LLIISCNGDKLSKSKNENLIVNLFFHFSDTKMGIQVGSKQRKKPEKNKEKPLFFDKTIN